MDRLTTFGASALALTSAAFLAGLAGPALADIGGPPPTISEVSVTFATVNPNCPGEDTLTIRGSNFDRPGELVVTLGDRAQLELCGLPTAEEIVAILPLDFPDGDFRLTVSFGGRDADDDDDGWDDDDAEAAANYDLTIGAVGPQGPPGPEGRQGPAGSVQVSSCEANEFVSGIAPDGTLVCSSLAGFVNQNCSVYLGWRDAVGGAPLPPSKVGRVSDASCEVLGADSNCLDPTEIFGVPVRLLGINTDGDVDGNDKFYAGLRCE